jgi:hypothetical protein
VMFSGSSPEDAAVGVAVHGQQGPWSVMRNSCSPGRGGVQCHGAALSVEPAAARELPDVRDVHNPVSANHLLRDEQAGFVPTISGVASVS